jgi:ABC-type enterochelin transport system ATPase subunit
VLPQFQSISQQTALLRTVDTKLEKQSTQTRVNIATVIHALIFFSSFHDDIIGMKKAWILQKAS